MPGLNPGVPGEWTELSRGERVIRYDRETEGGERPTHGQTVTERVDKAIFVRRALDHPEVHGDS